LDNSYDDGSWKHAANEAPHKCPHCGHFSEVKLVDSSYVGKIPNEDSEISAAFQCGYKRCRRYFAGLYKEDDFFGKGYYELETLWPKHQDGIQFSKEIKSLSPKFVKIFAEAEQAQQKNLREICGPGFRKSMEFLIKDYSVSLHPSKSDKIKAMTIGQVVIEFIDHPKIIELARRSFWLGNDETHYARKWEDKDLSDLHKLILATVSWIEVQLFTVDVINNMK
jgi:hypothetical protein